MSLHWGKVPHNVVRFAQLVFIFATNENFAWTYCSAQKNRLHIKNLPVTLSVFKAVIFFAYLRMLPVRCVLLFQTNSRAPEDAAEVEHAQPCLRTGIVRTKNNAFTLSGKRGTLYPLLPCSLGLSRNTTYFQLCSRVFLTGATTEVHHFFLDSTPRFGRA